MGVCYNCHNTNRSGISFRCTYHIKDYNETQILNYRGEVEIKEESKVKI